MGAKESPAETKLNGMRKSEWLHHLCNILLISVISMETQMKKRPGGEQHGHFCEGVKRGGEEEEED